MDLPVFETQRLILRGVTLEDTSAYERYFVDYDVIRNLNDRVPWPYPAGGVVDYFKTHLLPYQGKDKWVWGIILKDDPEEIIGAIELCRHANPSNRGFWLGRKFWGHGYMTEAVVPITDYAFESLGFDRLIFSNALGNIKSRRIKEKTGARFLYAEPFKFVDPKLTECEIWELTKESWQSFRGAEACPNGSSVKADLKQIEDLKP